MKRISIGALALLVGAGVAFAQGRPKAAVAPLVESSAPVGGRVHVALRVSLPEGVHVQSNRPRDPLLIPTVLAIEPQEGIGVDEIVYPPSSDFRQSGQREALAVFDREFVVGATLRIDPGAKAGARVVSAVLRYQACNESTCFAPSRESVQWTLSVVPPASASPRQHAEVFDRISFKR